MSYEPTQWATDDTVTAEKLNNMESGIENANTPLNADKRVDVVISIDNATGNISALRNVTYEEEIDLAHGERVLTFVTGENVQIYAKYVGFVSIGLCFEAYMPNLTDLTLRKFWAFMPIISPDSTGPISFTWADDQFIVNLTPTAQDFSGVMDKTVSEIYAAIEAGRRVKFRVLSGENAYNEVEVTVTYHTGSSVYPSINAYLVVPSFNGFSGLIFAWTGITNDPDENTYSTTLFPITPASN